LLLKTENIYFIKRYDGKLPNIEVKLIQKWKNVVGTGKVVKKVLW